MGHRNFDGYIENETAPRNEINTIISPKVVIDTVTAPSTAIELIKAKSEAAFKKDMAMVTTAGKKRGLAVWGVSALGIYLLAKFLL